MRKWAKDALVVAGATGALVMGSMLTGASFYQAAMLGGALLASLAAAALMSIWTKR